MSHDTNPLGVALRVARKEMTLFFAAPIAWLFLASFAAISLFVVFWGEAFFARNIADVRPLFQWMPLLLILLCSTLTMRLWSEERRTGTLEHVLTQPAPLWSFVLGKFLGCLALLAIALTVTVPLPLTVALLGELDPGPVFAGYLATFLLGAAYLAIGLFVSSRTENQIVALIGSIGLCGLFWLIGSSLVTAPLNQSTAELLRALGTGARFDAITRGVIDLRDLLYYLSLVVVFLTANVFVLERERWARGGRTGTSDAWTRLVGADGGHWSEGSEGSDGSDGATTPAPLAERHRRWRAVTLLVVLNALALNLWVGQLGGLRLDTTDGQRYTLSEATRTVLSGLREPLVLRGYFSAKTHPLLSPLVPEMRDLLREYEEAGDGRVRVEFVDPASDPEAEEEARQRYGIEPAPFQVADRYESSIVNAYFDVLVRYGDESVVLGFRDLIDVKTRGETDLDVRLRNPEYDLTRAIRRVLTDFRSAGDVFASVREPVKLRILASADERLPADLATFRAAAERSAREVAERSGGKFDVTVIDPEADGGAVAGSLARELGLRPLSAGLFSDERFWFHFVLSDGEQVVQLPLDDLTAESFAANLDAGLERFAAGFTRTVALVAPDAASNPAMQPGLPPGPRFRLLEDYLRAEYRVVPEDLTDGSVATEADLLLLVAPENLDERSLFAVDQFLMKGGTVLAATSPYSASLSRTAIDMVRRTSGLEDWLAHHGVDIGESLVMDPRNAAFPVPVTREVGGFRLQEMRLLDYPYFIDVRRDGLPEDSPVARDLAQVTMAWASPITLGGAAPGAAPGAASGTASETASGAASGATSETASSVTSNAGAEAKASDGRASTSAARRETEVLMSSSEDAWTSDSLDVMPRVDPDGIAPWPPSGESGARALAVAATGVFESWFAGKPSPIAAGADEEAVADGVTDTGDPGTEAATGSAASATADDGGDEALLADSLDTVIERSPESARLVVFASNDFLRDQVTQLAGSIGGTTYLAPYQLVANAVDAALDDTGLSGIRARGQFNRTLVPMDTDTRRFWELSNYALAALAIGGVFGLARLVRRRRERRQLAWLAS